MTTQIETALAAYIAEQLASFTAIAVRAKTSREEIPGERQLVVAVCNDAARRAVREQLFRPQVSAVVRTPVIEGLDVEDHASLVAAVRWALQPRVDAEHDAGDVSAARAALDAAFVADTGLHCLSSRAEGPRDAHAEDEWATQCDALICLTE